MIKKSISDISAKEMCILHLKKLDYKDIKTAGRDDGYDILAYKNSEKYFFEVKYSSKKDGKFFGTVMLTELHKAIENEQNFYFIICRGDEENADINDWFFKIISVNEFIKHCTLTTPIFHYHLYLDELGENTRDIRYADNTVMASKELILKMWHEFKIWKTKKNEN